MRARRRERQLALLAGEVLDRPRIRAFDEYAR
jgi:hypothetical protein